MTALLPAWRPAGLGLVLPYRWERFGPGLPLALRPIATSVVLAYRHPEDDAA